MMQRVLFAGSLIFVLSILLLWPGDAPFINDEPKLMLLAFDANQHHQIANHGLWSCNPIYGTAGLPYGPLTVWIYQVLLKVTTIPEYWILLRAAFIIAAIASGLYLLARALNLWKWFIPMVLSSPYIWFYSRHLWDNSFILPFSALSLGSYAYFLSKKSLFALFISIMTALMMPAFHFMALPLSITMMVHMIVYARPELWRLRFPVAGLLIGFVLLHLQYCSVLLDTVGKFHPWASTGAAFQWRGWVFPFLGGRYLSGCGLDYFFGNNWLPHSRIFILIKGITGLAYSSTFIGIFIAGADIYKKVIRPYLQRRILPKLRDIDVHTNISLLAMFFFFLQLLTCGLTRTYFHPHYYNGQWIINVLFAWLLVDRIVKKMAGKVFISTYGAALAALVITVAIMVHQRGGTRGIYYGPTIRNQLTIAAAIGVNNQDAIQCSVTNFVRYCSIYALNVICVKDDNSRIQGPMIIEYATPDSLSGFVRAQKNNQGNL